MNAQEYIESNVTLGRFQFKYQTVTKIECDEIRLRNKINKETEWALKHMERWQNLK